jgi:hypothetical protein
VLFDGEDEVFERLDFDGVADYEVVVIGGNAR